MNKKATAVIGANFGDESKGAMVDYFCSQFDSKDEVVNIRYNGGGQAGHTVVTPEGIRHVFKNFGAGTLAGAKTFLSKFFLVNPLSWQIERNTLPLLKDKSVWVDPTATVTTHYDMILNRLIESSRKNRHGSCGMGINETMRRNEAGFSIQVKDLPDRDRLVGKLKAIRDEYLPQRFKELSWDLDHLKEIDSPHHMDSFLDSALQFTNFSIIKQPKNLVGMNCVFEGAQGLLLDRDHEFFPHVTNSKTGLPNILVLAKELRIDELDVIYVSRTYLTRHGAGPLPGEQANLKYEDNTNNPNDWQGTLRFAPLNYELLRKTIERDLMNDDGSIDLNPILALTHCDQIKEDQMEEIMDSVCEFTDDVAPLTYFSDGPTRNDVHLFEMNLDYWQDLMSMDTKKISDIK